MKNAFVIAFILFVCVFAFLPKSVETGGFVLFVLGSIAYIGTHLRRFRRLYTQEAECRKLSSLFIIFMCVSGVYFLLSFLNLPGLWGIQGLLYSRSHIPRHFIIIAELFLPVLLAEELYRSRIFSRFQTGPLVLFFLFAFFLLRGALSMTGLLLVTLALISWRCNAKWLLLPAFFLQYQQSSNLLGFLVMMLLVCLEQPVTRYLYRNTLRKIILFASLAILGLFLASGLLAVYVENDANSLWRLQVWENEMTSLAQTCFTGVGFGSAYVTNDIVEVVENANMYIDNADQDFEYGVFIVANHSSLINMFYRMGLAGGILFLALNIQLVRTIIKLYHGSRQRERALLWRLFAVWMYQTVIIVLNPGLEMMQFALGYLLSLAFLLAAVLVINRRRMDRNVVIMERSDE